MVGGKSQRSIGQGQLVGCGGGSIVTAIVSVLRAVSFGPRLNTRLDRMQHNRLRLTINDFVYHILNARRRSATCLTIRWTERVAFRVGVAGLPSRAIRVRQSVDILASVVVVGVE